AQAAQHDRWAGLIRTSGLTDEQAEAVIDSDAFGALTAELRRAEANHHNVDQLLPRLIQARGLEDAEDLASIIHHRLAHATARLIAGLIPRVDSPVAADMRKALDERRDLVEARTDAVLDAALRDHESWTRPLGTPPTDARGQQRWRQHARVIAAYRDRYGIT